MDRNLLKTLLLCVSTLLAVTIAGTFFNKQTKFEDAALGDQTVRYLAKDKAGNTVHLVEMDSTNYTPFERGRIERGNRDVLLVLGNSQTHSINQMKAGEQTYVTMLYQHFDPMGIDVLTHSLPNANLQEHLLLFDYYCQKMKVKYLVLPVFMDDLRETGVRRVFMQQLLKEKFLLPDSNDIAQKINVSAKKEMDFENADGASNGGDMAALHKTVQEQVEVQLNDALSQHWRVWRNRSEIRGDLFNNLFFFRNTVLGINAQSVRRLLPSNLADNMAALTLLLQKAQQRKIPVVVYIPPLRNDIAPPYDPTEYKNFKQQLEKMTTAYPNVHFLNLESIVEGKYWGVKNSTTVGGKPEYDFMHFQYAGHQALAEHLLPTLEKIIAPK